MENADSDSIDTLTSSDCSDDEKYSDQTLSDNDDNGSDDDNSETESYRSLAFSIQSDRSTATIKSKKSKKRVQFKPGDSLVLVYIIPNREMLGLKSDSEDSDDSSDGADSDDDDDDDDSDDESEDEKDDSDDEENSENKNKNNKPKPFGKLMSIQQVTTHKKNERKITIHSNTKPARDKTPKLINLSLLPPRPPKRGSRASRRKERKEKAKNNKKENTAPDNKIKQGKSKRNKSNAITVDLDRMKRPRRSKPGILAIKATVKGDNKDGTTASVPKIVYKHDLKPSVINVNGALNVSQTKLLQRSKLQPVSLRVSKGGNNRPNSGSGTNAERQTNVRHAVSASYDSLTSLLPDSYNCFRHSIATDTLRALEPEDPFDKDVFERIDPGNMTARSKKHYAWQVANGNISSQSLRTPSILPFWDSLKDTVPGANTAKYPT